MPVAKYTEELAKKLKCKTKVEPWLHIVFSELPNHTNLNYRVIEPTKLGWAVYIWDTREIIEMNATECNMPASNTYVKVVDNHTPIHGGDNKQLTNYLNARVFNAKQQRIHKH
jgi:hypothetical protein